MNNSYMDMIPFPTEQLLETLKSRRRSLMGSESTQPVYGIDFIEVKAKPAGGWDLGVHFFQGRDQAQESKEKVPAIPAGITKDNVRITRIGTNGKFLRVEAVTYPGNESPALGVHAVETMKKGPEMGGGDEFISTSPRYFLELIDVPGMDTFFSRGFFFLGHSTPVDPRQLGPVSEGPRPVTPIDYLAKDYASFRRLILDQLSLLVPKWKERHVPDLGIAIVEILAYAGDYLSYFQDASSTEAYLGTARRRTSLRRHARLLDYRMHDGCNTRMPIQVQVDYHVKLEKGTPLLSKINGQGLRIPPEIYRENILLRDFQVRVFETMQPVELLPEHNEMFFYNWGMSGYVLEKGAVKAALEGHYPGLKPGDLLMFEEHRRDVSLHHLVRLNHPPVLTTDIPLKQAITLITWPDEDALPFDWPLVENTHTQRRVRVLGNIVLADYGRTIPGETLPPVPEDGTYYPQLKYTDVVYAVPYQDWWMKIPSGTSAMKQNPLAALPAVKLIETSENTTVTAGKKWSPRRDLLSSGSFAREFVVENESDGSIYLRFGDGTLGKKPVPGTVFKAFYRVNGGHDGHSEPGTIAHIVTDNGRITGIYNPVSSSNPVAAETLHQVRIDAPQAFKTQERCITPEDYAVMAERHPDVKEVRVYIRWTGSWHTVYIYVDRADNKPVNKEFISNFLAYLSPYRPSGIDLEIRGPFFVELVITLTIYLADGVFPGPVRQELTEVFSSGLKPDGTRGFFHPDNFTFGQTLYLSTLVTRAMQVRGVERVDVDEFRRYDTPPELKIYPDHIPVGALEILRLDNRADAPGNGLITFSIESFCEESRAQQRGEPIKNISKAPLTAGGSAKAFDKSDNGGSSR